MMKTVRDPKVTRYFANLKRQAKRPVVPDSYQCIDGPFEGFEIFLTTVGKTLPFTIGTQRGLYEAEYAYRKHVATWRAA